MRSVTYLCMGGRTRRYNVVALAFVLCAWLIAAAMHLHLEEQDAAVADSAHCVQCLALSASAAPGPEIRLPAPVAAPTIIIAFHGATFEGRTLPSSYLSRGPPIS